MKLSRIIGCLESRFPKSLAESWDNVGLMVGKRENEIKKIQISLDATMKAVDNAVENGADLIITHHPLIFSPLKNVNSDSLTGRKILKLIENKISVYSLHTNLDSSLAGLNDFLGEKLGFGEGKIIDPTENFAGSETKNSQTGIGRLYTLPEKEKLTDLIQRVKSRLKLETVTVSGYNIETADIQKVAVVNGAGSSYWKKAKRMGADLLITGDLKYHEALDAKEEGVYILDVGHYESEHFFHVLISSILEKEKGIEYFVFNDEAVLKKM